MQTHYDDFFEEVFVELETKVSHVIYEGDYNKYKAHCVQYETKKHTPLNNVIENNSVGYVIFN